MKYKLFLIFLILVFFFSVSCSKVAPKEENPSTQNNAQVTEVENQKKELEEREKKLEAQEEELKKKEMELEMQKKEAKLQSELEKIRAEKAKLEAERKRLEQEKESKEKAESVEKKERKEKEGSEREEAMETEREERAERAKRSKKIVVPEGTELVISLMEELSTAENEAGDRFKGVLDKSIKLKNGYKIPVKTPVVGKIVKCLPSGKVSGVAEMAIRLTKIKVNGKWYEIRTNTIRMKAKKTTKKDAAIVGGSSAIGAIIGGIVGGKKGAGLGALIAGGTGAAVVLNTKGKEIELPVETEFKFELRDDLVIKK